MRFFPMNKPRRGLTWRRGDVDVDKDPVTHSSKTFGQGKFFRRIFSKREKASDIQFVTPKPMCQDESTEYSTRVNKSAVASATPPSHDNTFNQELSQFMTAPISTPEIDVSSVHSIVFPKRTHGQVTIDDVIEAEQSTSFADEDQDQGDGLDQPTTDFAINKKWREIVRSQANNHAKKMADIRENHDAEIEAVRKGHKEAIDTADSCKTMLERRIEALVQAQAKFDKDSEAKDIMLQNVANTCQALQDNFDDLNTKHEAVLLDQSRIVGTLQEKNARLLGVILSMQAKEEASTHETNPPNQIEATLSGVEARKDMEQQLKDALKSKGILAKGLADAQRQSVYLGGRVRQLRRALEQSPNEVANIKGVIELKDRMFYDLERKASEYFTALMESKENSSKAKQLAEKETASLKAQIDHNQICISALEDSKSTLQRHWEDVRGIFQKKVLQSDFNRAMNDFYQLAIDDNTFLKAEVKRQASQISCKDLRIMSLQVMVQDIEKSLHAREETGEELRLATCSKDAEIWRLQIRLDEITLEHQDTCAGKDYQIADLSERLQRCFNRTLGMAEASRDDRERSFIRKKEDEIQALEGRCRDLMADKDDLYEQLNVQEETCVGDA